MKNNIGEKIEEIINGYGIQKSLFKDSYKELVKELTNLIKAEREEVAKECSDVSIMLETTLGYLDNAKHHNIDKHNKETGRLINEAIHHCEVAQRMLRKFWFPNLSQTNKGGEE